MDELFSILILGVLIWAFIKFISIPWSDLCNELSTQPISHSPAPHSSQKKYEPESMPQNSSLAHDSSVIHGQYLQYTDQESDPSIVREKYEPPRPYLKQNYEASIQRPYFRKRKNVIALDTESVGADYNGCKSMLARVSLVTRDGRVYDRYVKPTEPVTDYRTPYSGIRKEDLIDAEEFSKVGAEVYNIVKGCILVGHDLRHDFKMLRFQHPPWDVRDTSSYKLLREMVTGKIVEEEMRRMWQNISHYDPFEMTLCQVQAMNQGRRLTNPKPSLKRLAYMLLGREIQHGGHSSVEDAQAAMDLYLMVEEQWERDAKEVGL